MGNKDILELTTNRGEFNRAYKKYLEKTRNSIGCSRCKYHKGENKTTKYYGGQFVNEKWNIKYPNWKLVSKNPKQWMKKPIKIKIRYYGGYQRQCINITW